MPYRPNRTLKRLFDQAYPGRQAAEVMGFQQRLDQSQWMSRDEVKAFQLEQLKPLVAFAAREVAAYRGIDAEAVAGARTLEAALAALPILKRADLAARPLDYKAVTLPAGHTFSGVRKSSGTSGILVEVDVTNVAYGWQNALNLRSYLWSGWDFSRLIAGIRVDRQNDAPYPDGVTEGSWDAPTVFPFATGGAAHLSTAASLEQQWEWLSRIKPAYLITYPSIIRAFAQRAERERSGPCPLLGITTVGESVDSELREASKRFLGAELYDRYSSQEVGLIACQCDSNRRYHVQDESVIVEVLKEDGSPAAPGETGNVVVTALHNYGTPILRYDIGDIAEMGAPCSCGRGLMVLNRIVGRHRNIFRLRDGRSFWPSFGVRSLSKHMPVRQHQFRQLDFDRIEVVVATSSPPGAEAEQTIRLDVLRRLPAPFEISFSYVDDIPREPGGKYQEFLCLLPTGD